MTVIDLKTRQPLTSCEIYHPAETMPSGSFSTLKGNYPVHEAFSAENELNLLRRILLVDDEPKILASLERNLGKQFDVVTASNGMEALDILAQNGPFAVIVADMRMPIMDGLSLLCEAQNRAPVTTRIMLTGNSDQATAANAVNRSNVFRFHTKPCRPDELASSIEDGLDHYRQNAKHRSAQQRIQIAERTREELLHNMGHELRTPLNHIIGFAELLPTVPENNDNQFEYAGFIRDSGLALLEKINNLLDLSALRTGRYPTHAENLSIQQIADKCRQFVAVNGHQGCPSFTAIIEEGFPPITTDENALTLLLTCLLSNALKFNPLDVKVGFSAGLDDQGHPVIEIRDNGIGMDQSQISLLAIPFSQVSSGLTRVREGMGIGLSLATELAHLLGGTLSIESELGRGTAVRLRLPKSV